MRASSRGKVCIMTSIHPSSGPRIFHKEARTLSQAGYEVVVIAPHDKKSENVGGVQIMGLPKYERRFYRWECGHCPQVRRLVDVLGK